MSDFSEQGINQSAQEKPVWGFMCILARCFRLILILLLLQCRSLWMEPQSGFSCGTLLDR